MSKFPHSRYRSNKSRSVVNLKDTFTLRDLENFLLDARLWALTPPNNSEFSEFCVKIPKFSLPWQ